MEIPGEVLVAVVAEMDRHYIIEQMNLGYYRTESVCACGASWMSGDHDGDPDFDEQMNRHIAQAVIPVIAVHAWDEGLDAGRDRWMDAREFGDKPINPYRETSSNR